MLCHRRAMLLPLNLNLDTSPSIVLTAALLEPYGDAPDGQLIRVVEASWLRVLDILERDPQAIYKFSAREWEEIIAGSYREAGFDEVILTPRSGDHGRDVIATRNGFWKVRVFDQVKAYGPKHVVPADDARADGGGVWNPRCY